MSFLPPCPNCGAALQVSNRPGEKAVCPMCDQVFAIRHQNPAPAPAPGPYYPPQHAYPPRFNRLATSGLAIASMILGILALILFCLWFISIPCGVISIILGGIGAAECKGPNPRKNGMGMAIAGITCSAISVGLYVVIFLLWGISSI